MQPDTRKLLRAGLVIFGTGVVCAVSIKLFFGGYSRQGPHTNAGWLALMIALGCLPTGFLTLTLTAMKLWADRRR